MNSKKFIESDFKEHKIASNRQEAMLLQNSEWEKKKMDKGWAYVPKLDEPVPTLIFASPERQAIIARENQLFLKKRNKQREHDKKQKDIEV